MTLGCAKCSHRPIGCMYCGGDAGCPRCRFGAKGCSWCREKIAQARAGGASIPAATPITGGQALASASAQQANTPLPAAATPAPAFDPALEAEAEACQQALKEAQEDSQEKAQAESQAEAMNSAQEALKECQEEAARRSP